MNRSELQKDLEARVAKAKGLMGDLARKAEFETERTAIEAIGDQLRAIDKADADLRAAKDAESRIPAPAGIVTESGWASFRKQIRSMAEGIMPSVKYDLGNGKGGYALDLGQNIRSVVSGMDKRAITSNGGAINSVPDLYKALVDGGKLRSKVSVFTGKNAQTVVSVFNPHMALPVGSAEGATGTASDSTAVLTGQSLVLKPWYSTIAVSMLALISSDGLQTTDMPEIFSEAFGGAIDKAICVGAGTGSDMLGVFIASASGVTTSQDIACAAAGAPLWVDYVNLALQLLALGGDTSKLCIIVNPSVFNVALATAVAGTDPLKTAFLLNGTILGIPVVFSSYALTTLTAGSYVAVGGYFNHYALAVAQEIYIDQIKTVGSDNITFQSFMAMQGKPMIGPSFRRLKTV